MRLRVVLLGLAATLAASGAQADRVRVALLPVVVHHAQSDHAYLSEGFADMLSARLERSGSVEVIRLQKEVPATTETEVAVEEGKRAGADYVVYGSFTQFGEGASLDMRCAPVAGGDTRRVFIQSGSLGEIIPSLDVLAEKRYLVARGEVPDGGSDGPAAVAAGGESYQDLERRVNALERAVFVPALEPEASAPEEAPAAGGGAEEEKASSGNGDSLR